MVRRLLDFLQRYYSEDLGVAEICRLIDVNRRSLERACKAQLAMTPLQAYSAFAWSRPVNYC